MTEYGQQGYGGQQQGYGQQQPPPQQQMPYAEWQEMKPQQHHSEVDLVPFTISMIVDEPGALASLLGVWTHYQKQVTKSLQPGPAGQNIDIKQEAKNTELRIREILHSLPGWHEANFHEHVEQGQGYYKEHPNTSQPMEYVNDWGSWDDPQYGGQGYSHHQERGDPYGNQNQQYPPNPPRNDPYAYDYYGDPRYEQQQRQPHQSNWDEVKEVGGFMAGLLA